MDINSSFSIMWLSSQEERLQKPASLVKLLAILASLPSLVSSTSTTVLILSGVKPQRESTLSKSELVGLAAIALPPAVIAPAVSVLKLLIPPDALLKSRYRSNGGKKREYASNSNNIPALGRGLFIEGFRKYSFSGNILNAIKGATRFVCLFLVVDIAILGLQGKLILRAIRFYKYYNIF